MKNEEVSRILFEIAEVLEMKGENRFKIAAYRAAARAIEGLPIGLDEVYKKGGLKALKGIPGVGEHIALKIEELIKTGKLEYYKKIRKGIPESTLKLMNIPGMGPKRIEKLKKVLGIKSISDLQRAAKKGKLAKIPGFGAELEKDILDAIGIAKLSKGKVPLKIAEREAKPIASKLKKLKEAENIVVAGSVRRKKPMVRDLDILASSRKPEKVIDAFTKIQGIKKVLGKGKTKATIILGNGMQADLRVLKPESWGAGLLYFTGSKNYNIMLRKIAIKKGYKLNEYGLFDKKTGKMIAGKTEQDVLKKLGVKWVPPEKREI